MRLKAFALIALLLFATASFSQEITGTIIGTVKDSTGAVVSNATVTVKNTDTGVVVRTVKTSANGEYVAPLLPIGRYSVTAEAPGFKKTTQSNIELNVNDKLTYNFSMEVGRSEQEVTVEANPVQVELQTAATAGLVTGTQVRELSLNNRNYIQLVSLMPGVSSTQPDQFYVGLSNPLTGGFNTLGISVNGQRTSANNWTVDGADNVDRGSNLGLLTTPSVDTIAEFKVLRSNYSAEFGRTGAAQVNVITRSGTSSLHGSAYEFWRNENLNADTFFGKQTRWTNPAGVGCDPTRWANDPGACDGRKPLRYHNFGYNIGGPVYIPGIYPQRDKTFFFFSQEFRRVISYSSQDAYMPTAAELTGSFATQVCIAYAADGTCANTGTQIAAIDPVAAGYIKDIWSKAPLAPNPSNRVVRNFYRAQSNFREETVKIDHTFSQKLAVYGRYLHDSIPTTEPLGLFGPNTYLPGVGTTESKAPGWSLVGRATATFSPTLMLELGYNFSYGAILSTVTGLMNPANSPDVKVNLPFPSTLQRLPTISFSSAGSLSGVGSYGPYEDYNRNHQALANLTKILGKHTMKFGGTYYHYQKTENNGGNNAGTFTFRGGGNNLEQAWANFLLGNVYQYTQASLDLYPDVRDNQVEIYGQDEWRIRPNLTLSYGVRHSMFRQPTDAKGFLTNFDPSKYSAANAPQLSADGGTLVAGPGDLLNGIVPSAAALTTCPKLLSSGQVPVCWAQGTKAPYGDKVGPEDNSNFAPRIGIAWDPFGDGKTSIRAGYGMFYDTGLFGIVEQNIFGNIPFVNSLSVYGTTFSTVAENGVSLWTAPKVVGSRIDNNFKTPYVQNWNLSVQHELGQGLMFDVSYVGNKGTHLIGLVDINQPKAGAWVTAGILPTVDDPDTALNDTLPSWGNTSYLNLIRPYKGYDAMTGIRSWYNSNYNSLQASLEKRFKGNSILGIAYTWSRAMTDNQTDRSTAPRDMYNPQLDYGPTQQDRRHVFTANFVYTLPFLRDQRGFVGHLFGGWELSGILNVASGTPFTIYDYVTDYDMAGQGCQGNSACWDFPDVVGPIYQGQQKNTQGPWVWFNKAAFASVPTTEVRNGNARRGAVYGPGFWRQDLSLFKNMKFTERFNGQLRFETFNVFNHTNPLTINTTNSAGKFGQVTDTRDPRIIQLGLKLNF